MKYNALLSAATLGVFLSFASVSAYAQDSSSDSAHDSDNTAVNARDRHDSERTADQAQNNMPDRVIMQKIRKSVMADKSLSTYAHNVKIIAENGKVTLKGPVRSKAEKQTIEKKAINIAGAGNVTNEISIKATHHS